MPEYRSPADQYWELKNYGWTDADIIGRFGPDNPISRIAALEARNAAAGGGSYSAAALAGQPNVGTAPTIPMNPAELVATQGTTDILTTAPNTERQVTARVIDPNAAPTPFPTRPAPAPAPDPVLHDAQVQEQAARAARLQDRRYLENRVANGWADFEEQQALVRMQQEDARRVREARMGNPFASRGRMRPSQIGPALGGIGGAVQGALTPEETDELAALFFGG